ncbi:MAG: hypothetical protein WAO74_05660 [Polaribacter sp.]|uniref:hypothetical protein n=1 Tax=Polaribacter sp. TaxID=1920175 RepID=UPI003BB2063C
MKEIAKYPIPIYIVIFLIFYGITYISGVENPLLRTVFSVTLAFVLSPKRKKIQTQTGTKTQITWIFLKESIIIN